MSFNVSNIQDTLARAVLAERIQEAFQAQNVVEQANKVNELQQISREAEEFIRQLNQSEQDTINRTGDEQRRRRQRQTRPGKKPAAPPEESTPPEHINPAGEGGIVDITI
jgi:hypothetical protein